MKPRLLILLTVASIFLGTLPSDRAWGYICKDNLGNECDTPGGQSCVSIFFFKVCFGGAGGGGGGGGGGGNEPTPDTYPPPDIGTPMPRWSPPPSDDGTGKTPTTFFKPPDFSPKENSSRVAKVKGQLQVRLSTDNDREELAIHDVENRVPRPRRLSPEVQGGTEPVSDNGPFVVDKTDVMLPFFDNPFVFTRHYRSDVKFQTALGYGWSHSYYQHIIESQTTSAGGPAGCQTEHPDVFYQDARLNRYRFVSDSVNGGIVSYKAPVGVSLRLTKDLSNPQQPWTIDDGSGTLLHFSSGWGDLVSIVSPTGHRQEIAWNHDDRAVWGFGDEAVFYNSADSGIFDPWEDPNGYVDHVTHFGDGDNRTVYFIYKPVNTPYKRKLYFSDDVVVAKGPPHRTLQCLSLGPDCASPLVSFAMGNSRVGENTSTYSHWSNGNYTVTTRHDYYLDSFDLEQVIDANGHSTTYAYDHSFDNTPDGTYILSKNLDEYCHRMFGDKQKDCRNWDLCGVTRDATLQSIRDNCAISGFRNYCMYSTWNGQPGGPYNCSYVHCYKPEGCTACGLNRGCEGDDSDFHQRGPFYSEKCVNDLTAQAEKDYPIDQCRLDKIGACLENEGINLRNGKYAFGYPSDLKGNMLKITDGNKRTSIENIYGTDLFKPDFDKVITHVQGMGQDATMTTEYVDIAAEFALLGGSDWSKSFHAVEICPNGPDPSITSQGPNAFQTPAYVVIAHDIGNVTRTTYFDEAWRRIREIREDGGQTDYSYKDGYLKAVQDPAGRRVCYERDSFGRPLSILELPSTKYQPASPVLTKMTYDDAGQLIEAVRDFGGPNPTGMQMIRDKYERVLAIGRAVSAEKTDWTCYQYDPSEEVPVSDNLQAPIPPEGNILLLPSIEDHSLDPTPVAPENEGLFAWFSDLFTDHSLDPAPSDGGQYVQAPPPNDGGGLLFSPSPALKFTRSGCASNLQEPVFKAGSIVDVTPAFVIRPDGSLQINSLFGPSGPQEIMADAYGPDPQKGYIKYEAWGRFWEGGRGTLNQPIPGASTQAVYNQGQLTTVGRHDPNTGQWVNTGLDYDQSGNVKSKTGPELKTDIVVDELGYTRSIHEYPLANGNGADRWTYFDHDIHGRLLSVTRPGGGGKVRYDYDPTGRPVSVSQLNDGGIWEKLEEYAYEENGLLKSSKVNGLNVSYVRDGFGRAVAEVTPHSLFQVFGIPLITQNSVVRGLDSQGRVSWEAVYNGSPPNYKKPAGPDKSMESMTEYFYDALSRVIQVGRWKFANGVWDTDKVAYTKIAYDSSTNTVTTTDPEGKISVVQTDALGRIKRGVSAKGTQDEIVTTYKYEPGDKVTVTSTVPPTNQVLQYNVQGALKTVTIDGKTMLSQDHDSLGRLVKAQPQGLGPHAYSYDAHGLLDFEEQQTDANTKARTDYGYDRNGRLSSVIDAAGKKTEYFYDGLGRLTKKTNGLGDTTYDAYLEGTDRLLQMTDPAGTKRTSTYFLDGLLQSETIDNGPGLPTAGLTIKRFYDYTASGRIEKARLEGGGRDGKDMTVSMSYDSLGRRLTEYNDQLPLAVSRQYRPGQVTKTIIWGDPLENHLPVMEEITGYDNLYRTTAVQLKIPGDLPPSPVVRMGYQDGLLKTLTYGNQVSQATLSYNGRARLTGVEVKAGDKTIAKISDWLGVDDVPRARVRTLGPLAPKVDYYGTDLSRRLITENLGQPFQPLPNGDATNEAVEALMNKAQSYRAYTLDGASNWLSRTGTDPLTPGTPDAVNRYPTIDGNTLSYDKAGNLQNGMNETFIFNGLGHLVQAHNDKGGVTYYTYDPLGRRITASDGKVKNLFIWDGDEMIAYGPGENDANKFRLIVGGSAAHYALADQLGTGRAWYLHPGTDGSTLAVTNDQGQFAEGYSYNGYGEATVWDAQGQSTKLSSPAIDNRFLFQGQWFNPETGLHTMGLREYKADIGRWIEKDPIGLAGGPNLYAYVGGRPLSLMDPTGMNGTEDKPGGESGGGWQHYRYPSLGRELSEQAGRVFGTIASIPGIKQVGQVLGWASHQIGRGYRTYAGWVMEGETMESLSAGEDLALDLGEGLFTNGVMTGGPAAVGKGLRAVRGLGGEAAGTGKMIPIARYEGFEAGQQQLMMDRVRASLTEGDGIVTKTSEEMSTQLGRGITYREQINKGTGVAGSGPLSGEKTGRWLEFAHGPNEGRAQSLMHTNYPDQTFKVTYWKEWDPNNHLSNPEGGIHSTLFDTPELYSTESGVGFLAPPGRGVVVDAVTIYDVQTGSFWHYVRRR